MVTIYTVYFPWKESGPQLVSKDVRETKTNYILDEHASEFGYEKRISKDRQDVGTDPVGVIEYALERKRFRLDSTVKLLKVLETEIILLEDLLEGQKDA